MSLPKETIEGTLRADGTLVLDHEPTLPRGRVRVVIQVVPPTPARPAPGLGKGSILYMAPDFDEPLL
jgi:hypothetical protein